VCNSPPINFIQNSFALCLPMHIFKILYHPLNEVVLEYPLYDLVKEVRGDQFIDVRIGEVFSERLKGR
jgi:hypothetical protein